MPEPKQILTPEEFAELRQEKKFPYRRNTSLHKGGAVDIYISTEGEVVAVLRYVTLTKENTKEITAEIAPLIAAAEKKAPAIKAVAAAEAAKSTPTEEPPAQPTDATAETES